jgi:hypothetical protein
MSANPYPDGLTLVVITGLQSQVGDELRQEGYAVPPTAWALPWRPTRTRQPRIHAPVREHPGRRHIPPTVPPPPVAAIADRPCTLLDQVDLDTASTSTRHLRLITAANARDEDGDPDGCSAWSCRSGIPVEPLAVGDQRGRTAA